MNKEQTIMICPQCGEIDGSCKDNYDCPHAKCIRCGCDMIPTEYKVSIIYKMLEGRPSDYDKFKEELREKYTLNNDLFNAEKYQSVLKYEQERRDKHIVATDEDYEKEKLKQNQENLRKQNSPKCPTCGSANIKKISTSKKISGGLMFGLFSINVRKTFECLNCKYKW